MYSQCPECLTRFRVTAAALRAARGTVRCGRCGSAFDALPHLTDSLQQDADTAAGPAQQAEGGSSAMAGGATAAGLLAADEGASLSEFQFSADDIDNVFVDVRDWQNRFGESSSPGDRAGKLGDTSSAELDHLLERDDDTDHDDSAPPGSAESTVWVHEPESIEDITLEGERIQIEGFAGFEEDFLEREIERELEEQHRAEITGSQRLLADPDDASLAASASIDGSVNDDEFGEQATTTDDAVPLPGIAPLHDLDSTDRFEILREVPESAFPDETAPAVDVPPPSEKPLVVLGMPAAVATAAAGLALARPAAAAPADTASDAATAPPPAAPRMAPWRRVAEAAADADAAAAEHEHDPQLADDLAAAASARRASWAWGLGALVLGLFLSAQLIHHFRLQLARDASVGPTLREAYARIGRPLPPNWSLGDFELRQWGANEAAPSPAGTMTVRASITNGAAFAQPMPLLRLELEDRFGGTVARRDFEPREYLKDPAQAGRLLGSRARTEAELAVVDATAEAVGYRLDICLRDEAGAVSCTQDLANKAGAGSSQAPQ